MKVLVVFFFLFLFSCGGGANFSVSPLSVRGSLSTDEVFVELSEKKDEKVGLTLQVFGGDVFPQSVLFKSVKLDYYSVDGSFLFTRFFPLNFTLSTGGSREVSISVFTVADKLNFEIPVFFDFLGRVSCLRGEDGRILSCTRDFSGELSQDPLLGYCTVTAGNLRLVERVPGVFSGDGTGVLRGRSIEVYFSSDPVEGVHVIVTCISRYASLKVPYRVDISLDTDRGNVFVGSVYFRYIRSFSEVIGR